VFGSGQIRVPHAQIDDILSPPSRLHLQLVDDAEDIGRKSHHAMESQTLRMK